MRPISFVFAAALFGQTAPGPRFEVASIRPSDTAIEQVSVGVHIDGARVSCTHLSLRDYIRAAYRIKDYQISAPDWVGSDRYDIAATLPEGAKQSDVPAMLASLLADRFRMTLHHETREFPVYALVVSKTGLKLKESPIDPDNDSPGAAPVNVTGGGSRNGVAINLGHGASFSFADNKLAVKRLTMAQFAETLARFVDKPVIDKTGLTAAYDAELNFSDEDYRAMLIRSAINAGVVLPPQARQVMEMAAGDSLGSAMQAAGLKLDSRKEPIDVLVIDRMEKTPAEN